MARTDRASRDIAAARDRVYAALIDPAAMVVWLPPDGMTASFEHFDARPGGSYRMVLTYKDPAMSQGKSSSHSDIVDGRFVELVAGERVVQEVEFVSADPRFAGTMRMSWLLESVDMGTTRVLMHAADVPAGISAADHEAGMASSLANLAAYLKT